MKQGMYTIKKKTLAAIGTMLGWIFLLTFFGTIAVGLATENGWI